MHLSSSDPGVDDHEFLSDILEMAATYDQLNVCELASFERISRRYQLWEERYSEQLKSADAGGVKGSSSDFVEERRLFLGNDHGSSLALVCPALSKFVASKLQDEAAILKERRKGREERVLAISAPAVATKGKPRGGRGGGRG